MEHALQLTCSGQSRQIGHSSSSLTIDCELDFLIQNKASSRFKAWMSRFTRTPLNQKSCPALSAARHGSLAFICSTACTLTRHIKATGSKCNCNDCVCHIGVSSLDAWQPQQHLPTMLISAPECQRKEKTTSSTKLELVCPYYCSCAASMKHSTYGEGCTRVACQEYFFSVNWNTPCPSLTQVCIASARGVRGRSRFMISLNPACQASIAGNVLLKL